MKIKFNIAEHYTETEITVNCSSINDEIYKILASIQMSGTKIVGYKDKKEHILEIIDITYIESVDKRTIIYTLTGTFESSLKLYELEDKLSTKGFIRVSRYCIVNIKYIKSIETELNGRLIITMPNDIKQFVSRQYANEIKIKLEAQYA